jgi:hypothetical protein
LSEQEKEYNAVSDSLTKYKTGIVTNSKKVQQSLEDYMKLDYDVYKSKYKLSEKEMNDLAHTFTTSYQIAKTMIAIEKNMSDFSKIDKKIDAIEKKMQKEPSDYRHNRKESSDHQRKSEYEVMMEAYNSEQETVKSEK